MSLGRGPSQLQPAGLALSSALAGLLLPPRALLWGSVCLGLGLSAGLSQCLGSLPFLMGGFSADRKPAACSSVAALVLVGPCSVC